MKYILLGRNSELLDTIKETETNVGNLNEIEQYSRRQSIRLNANLEVESEFESVPVVLDILNKALGPF